MSLTENKAVDQIMVSEDATIFVRQVTRIIKDGAQIAESFHRWTFAPGDEITIEEPKVSAIANAVWTQEVIDAYNAKIAATAQPQG